MDIPSLKDVPEVFETARLLLRCPRIGDGVRMHAAVAASLPALRRFPASMPWAMEEPSVGASEQFCREGRAHYLMRMTMPWLLFPKGTDIVAGCVVLHTFDWSVPKAEIGYWGHSAYHGQGLVTEAVQAITAMAFSVLGLRRVEALPDDENLPSWRVCERAGYRLEGTRRHDRMAPDGRLRDSRVYAALN